jgi:putative transposase
MARKPRIQLADYTQHVIQRGANREACFFADADYRFYLGCLSEALKLHDCECHAYVLMTNHVHLLLTPRRHGALAKVMKLLSQRYTQYVNFTYCRTGSIWEGRYKSSVIDVDHYLLTCYRYIELNPVRAAMVGRPSEYLWSSARFHGFGISDHAGGDDDLIVDHGLYLGLGSHREERQEAYRELFRGHMDDDFIHKLGRVFTQEQILGDSQFREVVEKNTTLRVERVSKNR